MRSIPLLTATTVIALGAWACGDDGGTDVGNPPVASFTQQCTDLACTFTDQSTPLNGISSWSWTFGDINSGLNNTSTQPSPTHTFSGAGTYDVTLTVMDVSGATDSENKQVTVGTTTGNTPPTASFTHTCNAANCTFTSTSTDVAPGTIATYVWTFGDGATADVSNPSHSYAVTAPTDFTVTLIVTDNEGATDVETQTVTVSPPPPAVQGCTTSDKRVECVLDITARSTVKLKLIGINCDLEGSRIITPPSIGDQVFLRVCWRTVGEELGIYGGPTDSLIVFEAGTQLRIWFVQGTANADYPVLDPPAGHLVGTFPNWTINFEDGDNPGEAGEPDFTDVVLGVQATVVP